MALRAGGKDRLKTSQRVQRISLSMTKEMDNFANRIGGCVSLGQGVPSFNPPVHIRDAASRAITENPNSAKYSLQTGMPELRQAIVRYMQDYRDVTVDPKTEVCVTVGGMEALLTTVLSIVDEGDEVVIPSPSYASYIEQVMLAGGVPRFVPLASDWALNLQALEETISEKTAAVILANPGNPTGNVFSPPEITAICELARQYNFFVVIDEAYDFLVYDETPLLNPASLESIDTTLFRSPHCPKSTR